MYSQISPLPAGGVLGTLEFRDGKGRVSATEVDEGNVLFSWSARSGRINGRAYDVNNGNGHTPPGWYLTYQRTDLPVGQSDEDNERTGQDKIITQGGYVRWKQDDETDPSLRYTETYKYQGSEARDRDIGEPTPIKFKWQMEVIPPTDRANRTQIQIHPDGRKDGTQGCVGIQQYDDCKQADYILRRFHSLKLFVELEPQAE